MMHHFALAAVAAICPMALAFSPATATGSGIPMSRRRTMSGAGSKANHAAMGRRAGRQGSGDSSPSTTCAATRSGSAFATDLDRLKRIDGRAPVSIMTCQIDPKHQHLQQWLKEGLSLETHTYDHPCPLLKDGDLAKAKATFDRAIDLLAQVPNSKPVAFRMPCCDSLNTLSPRFFTEIFQKTTPAGRFLELDSSVFNIITANDPELPRDLVFDEQGRERFRRYVPVGRSFVNTIEDYPYPYQLDRVCWEFPCVTPSDWQAQYLQQPCNPLTIRDWKAALDATVIKQGVFCLVFHPYNWVKPQQVVDFIDHAVQPHGQAVKFMTFKEAKERLDKTCSAANRCAARPAAITACACWMWTTTVISTW